MSDTGIGANWFNKEPYKIELTEDQVRLLEDGNVIPRPEGTLYVFPYVIEKRADGYYVLNCIHIDKKLTDEQAGSIFEDPSKIKFTINE